jgi:hypothetical protein
MNDDQIRCVRVYNGDDGEARFEDLLITLDEDVFGWKSVPLDVTGADFRIIRPEYPASWSRSPHPRLIIILGGVMLIELGDGSTRRLEAGDVFLNEDFTGQGHKAHNDGTVRRIMTISLEPGFDVDTLRGSPKTA